MGASRKTRSVIAFPPLVGEAPRLLILGSLPGVRSLQAGEYYAHPRNAFWPIMGALFGAHPELSYAERVAALTGSGIALWDVLAQAHRPGSADAAIDLDSAQANRFDEFLPRHPGLRCVAFNGAAAAALYRRKVLPHLPATWASLPQRVLPSSSPAHASLNLAAKRRRWRVALL